VVRVNIQRTVERSHFALTKGLEVAKAQILKGVGFDIPKLRYTNDGFKEIITCRYVLLVFYLLANTGGTKIYKRCKKH